MLRKNRTLLIIALIAVVNALGYGIIIPILYSYTHTFGLTDFETGLLFSIFSLGQLISTPIIGKLSDKYGRKPLLLISLAGTAVSFFLMAFSKVGWLFFVARALDGITAGNIPVASAVISDSTEPKDRAKGFGLIGAAFGFGFVFGPAISAVTVGIHKGLPFLIAGSISVLAVVLTAWLLPETHKRHATPGTIRSFHFSRLFTAIADPRIGLTLLISLFYSLSFSMFTFAYQPLAVKLLNMSATLISVNFTLFGVVGLISQAALIPWAVKKFGEVETIIVALFVGLVSFLFMSGVRDIPVFMGLTILFALANSTINPLVQALLSKEVEPGSQGSILGLNASYISIGMILGPILGGVLAVSGLTVPMVAGGMVCGFCILLTAMHRKRMITHKVRV